MSAVDMNQEMFSRAMEEGSLLLVDYWAPWCGYCRRIGPAYEKVAEKFGEALTVAKINIDDEPQLAHAEQIEVIPTLVLYREGKAIASVVAPESRAAIERFITENLAV